MCYNCKVFDNIELPNGYNKIYIEWLIPDANETIEKYTKRMAENIDVHRPFILVGYSFGAVIIQEMNKFLSPMKNIVISSFKKEKERPVTFRIATTTNIIDRSPMRLYSSSRLIVRLFNKYVCDAPLSEIEEYMTVTDPVYVKWSAKQITSWIPTEVCPHLYHIHGTKDPIFAYGQLEDVYPVEDGDHLMILRKTKEVSSLLTTILTKKE